MQQDDGMEPKVSVFLELTGAKSIRAIAATSGLDVSTTNRQLNGTSNLAIETVVAICRAYNLDFAETFVAVGIITQKEADALGRAHSLAEYTDLELAQEIVNRLESGEAGEALTEPIGSGSNVIVGSFGDNASPTIPENVEEEWGSAAHPDTEEPEDHTP